jgi:anaerobic magnesium-protoporphyrin IX monomethyl ester cyclase
MKILLLNPPYLTFTSILGVGHQVPLGLLAVGGALIDAGHTVELLDAECRRMSLKAIADEVRRFRPELVMTGHAGSTPAHPVCLRTLRTIKEACPDAVTVYGGVYPTYHAARILAGEPAVDFIVRGEGEATAQELVGALQRSGETFRHVRGIAYRAGGKVVLTPERPPIPELDAWRVGWELIDDWDRYHCFGLGRAAVVQFSRGCPHRCTYCGQHGFWVRWRHRSAARFADEVEWLHRTHGVNFFTLADENPTTSQDVWRDLLEELAARRLPVYFFATIRATDIVRDADFLPLYHRAGMLYVLMGIDSTSDRVLRQVRKGSTTGHDIRACQLLQRHGIFSILGHIVGLGEETAAAFRTAQRRLQRYGGDYLNAMYATPHRWTPFGQESEGRAVVQPDLRKWDYRHQVLAERHLKPWQLFLRVKWLELCFHLRPGRLWAVLRDRDRFRRRQRLWGLWHTGLVWLAELAEFLLAALRPSRNPSRPPSGGTP